MNFNTLWYDILTRILCYCFANTMLWWVSCSILCSSIPNRKNKKENFKSRFSEGWILIIDLIFLIWYSKKYYSTQYQGITFGRCNRYMLEIYLRHILITSWNYKIVNKCIGKKYVAPTITLFPSAQLNRHTVFEHSKESKNE